MGSERSSRGAHRVQSVTEIGDQIVHVLQSDMQTDDGAVELAGTGGTRDEPGRGDGEAFEACRLAMECPDPRVALGEGLRGLASAAIDVSDGLLGDLGHILKRSRVGAELFAGALPCSPWLLQRPRAEQLDCILAGGDDYELLFTAPPAHRDALVT